MTDTFLFLDLIKQGRALQGGGRSEEDNPETASIAFLLVSCQNTEDEAMDQNGEPAEEVQITDENGENTTDTEENNDETNSNESTDENSNANSNNDTAEKESANETADNNTDAYAETQVAPYYFIDSHTYVLPKKFLTAFSIERGADEDLSAADRLKSSLIENDSSEQNILGSFTDMAVDWPTLHVNFNVEGNQLSTTSAQTGLYYDSLLGISDLYGIEEIIFYNPAGEQNITVAQRLVDKPIVIEDVRERGLSRGYYTIYDKDLKETLFLSGGDLEEEVIKENGEPLSFPETIEAMGTVENGDAFYSSAIVEGFESGNASFENGVATVNYTIDEEVVTEADQIVFAKAMQLAALDFEAQEIRLVNDTLQETVMYPLVTQ